MFSAVLLCAALLFAADSYQPLNVKTGLWQVTEVSTASGAPPITPEMQAKMDQMTPEQRARIQAMIKSRFGGTPHTNNYQKCITAKDLNTNPWANGTDDKCNWTVQTSTSSDMEVKGSSCEAGKNQGMKTDVDVKLHVLDPENVKATMNGTSTGNATL